MLYEVITVSNIHEEVLNFFVIKAYTGLCCLFVITSYSIHYTKLYEFAPVYGKVGASKVISIRKNIDQNYPVLISVKMLLQREPLPWLNDNTFYLISAIFG